MPRFPGAVCVRDGPDYLREPTIMVKIRLSRGGAKGRPFYHIVVADERYARDGRNIDRIGYFNPVASGKDVPLELNVPRAQEWIAKGAQPTAKVKQLIKQAAKAQKAA